MPASVRLSASWFGVVEDGEDKPVGQGDGQRLQQGPEVTQDGLLVLDREVATNQQPQDFPVAPDVTHA